MAGDLAAEPSPGARAMQAACTDRPKVKLDKSARFSESLAWVSTGQVVAWKFSLLGLKDMPQLRLHILQCPKFAEGAR
jgi:hypothetical protein